MSATTALLTEALQDESSATRLRHDQLRKELRKLGHQEENLIDLAAEGTMPTAKVRSRLLDVAARKAELTARLSAAAADMSSPMSSLLLDEALVAAVSGGVVGGVVLPATPDDVGPAAGEDAFGVGVGFAAGAELAISVGGPGVASPAVAGEVADRVAEFCCQRTI